MTMHHIILHPWRSTSQGFFSCQELINLSFPGRGYSLICIKGMAKMLTEFIRISISVDFVVWLFQFICVNIAKSITNYMYIVLKDSLATNLHIHCIYPSYCLLDRMPKNIYETHINAILCRYDSELTFFGRALVNFQAHGPNAFSIRRLLLGQQITHIIYFE